LKTCNAMCSLYESKDPNLYLRLFCNLTVSCDSEVPNCHEYSNRNIFSYMSTPEEIEGITFKNCDGNIALCETESCTEKCEPFDNFGYNIPSGWYKIHLN
jgi:hypothetical protein